MNTFSALLLALHVSIALAASHKILITNDDGWATAQIRAQTDALAKGGFDVRPV